MRGGDVDLDHHQVRLVVEIEALDVLVLERDLVVRRRGSPPGWRGPRGGNSEYLIGRKKGLTASVRAGRIIFTFTSGGAVARAAAQDLHGEAAVARPVQLHQEDALPLAEIEPAVGDVQAHRDAEQQGPGVGVAVGPLVRAGASRAARSLWRYVPARGRPALRAGPRSPRSRSGSFSFTTHGRGGVPALHRDQSPRAPPIAGPARPRAP